MVTYTVPSPTLVGPFSPPTAGGDVRCLPGSLLTGVGPEGVPGASRGSDRVSSFSVANEGCEGGMAHAASTVEGEEKRGGRDGWARWLDERSSWALCWSRS